MCVVALNFPSLNLEKQQRIVSLQSAHTFDNIVDLHMMFKEPFYQFTTYYPIWILCVL